MAVVHAPTCIDCGIALLDDSPRARLCVVDRRRRRAATFLKQAARELAGSDPAAHGAVEVLIGRLEVRR